MLILWENFLSSTNSTLPFSFHFIPFHGRLLFSEACGLRGSTLRCNREASHSNVSRRHSAASTPQLVGLLPTSSPLPRPLQPRQPNPTNLTQRGGLQPPPT